MKLGLSLSLVISGVIGSASSVFADSKPTLNDTIPLQEVSVVSTIKTDVNRNQIPFTVSVVNREIIEESTKTGVLSIVSEQIPGVFVTEKGVTGYGISDGSAGTVNVHGVGGNKVLMLFDGQPMWAGVFGHNIPDSYVASDAEKIEIIRGPGSLLYGSNALGGVINVITRKAKADGIHGQGRIMYGSYNTQKYLASVGYKKDKFNALVSLNRDQTDGQRDNSAFYVNNGYVKLGYELTGNWNVSGDVIIADFKTNDPGLVTNPKTDHWAKALRSTYSLSVNNNYEKMSGALQVFYNNGDHKINDGYIAGRSPRTFFFRSTDFNQGINLFESFRLIDSNLFTIGVDAKQWGGHAWNDSINGKIGEIVDRKVTEIAGYAVVQQTLFDKLTLNAGVRLENNEGYGTEWIPQSGLAYRLNPQTTFKASVSKGFRSPNVRELYISYPPYSLANPDLKPEKMNNYDISYLQSLAGNKINFELTAFYAQGKNMIATVNSQLVNTDKFKNKGIDFSFHYQLFANLKLSGNYSFLESDVKISAAPKHKTFFNADWKTGKFKVSPNIQYVSGLYLETVQNEDLYEEYTLLNCKVSYQVYKQLKLFVNGENLTDTSYQMYSGYPMPGIVVLGGVDFKF
jgi:iron complex outermembrane receptor protein